jgi:CheY-like chemotaxis protein
LVSLIEEVVNLSLSGSNVKPVITSATNLWQVRVDQRQIQQVFANLTFNAREAMPGGGLLTIAMENAELADKTEHGLIGGKYLQITVTDEGTGIEHKLLDKIFDPYFTTKEMGSGLGLATAYSIIDKHGGHISVISRLGKGTTFAIYLPATEVVEETPLTQPGVAQVPLTQGAKILVMDDEEMIRNMLNEMLGELGFAVETAVEGQQAIDMYQQAMDTGKSFAIVILDLTIPGGMGGQEAAKGILQIDPEVKMIVSSGYADDPIIVNYTDHGFKGVATKPYSMNKLSGVLDQVMEKG